MAESFEEFMQCINIASSSEPESLDDLKNITFPLYAAPDLLNYILQIYESNDRELLRFIPILPSIFENFISYHHKQSDEIIYDDTKVILLIGDSSFFKRLLESNPEMLGILTDMLLENYNVDNWFCEKLWNPIFTIANSPEILYRIFERMKDLFEICLYNLTNNNELRKAFLLFNCIYSQRTHIDLFQTINFEEFAAELFTNYFTIQNIENESLAQLTGDFVDQMISFFKFSFDFFFSEEQCLIQLFDFIDYLSRYDIENPLANKTITQLFHTIIKNIHGYIFWILSPDNDRFTELRKQFIDSYLPIIFQKSVELAPVIVDSFPYDSNSLISRINLRIIGNIIPTFKNDDLVQYFEVLLQLSYIYADLPQEFQDQYIINPSVFYYSSYCLNVLTEFEPRSFSYYIIFYLFNIDPVSTIQFLINSDPSPGLIFLIGNISSKIIHMEKSEKSEEKEKIRSILTDEILNGITSKIGELLCVCDFEPDSLFLKANSLLFLTEEQIEELFEISFNILQETSETNSDNFTEEAQFLFTIASKIVYSLLYFFRNQEIYNSLSNHISFILQNVDFCLTYDAINSISLFFKANEKVLYENAGMLFDVYLSVILKITNNFNDDLYDVTDINEAKIAESSVKFILEIFKIKNAEIEEQSFIDFIHYFFCGKEKILTDYMSDMMKHVAFYGPVGYIDYLTLYFDYSKKIKFYNFADFYAQPFIIFIYYKTDIFLVWESRDEFIEFSISSFFNFTEREFKQQDPNFEDSYYLGLLVCMFILTPDLLPENITNDLYEYAIAKLRQFDDPILKLNCFNIVTSIIHVSNIAMPDDIIEMLLEFIANNYSSFRKPEKIRYLTTISATRELYSDSIKENIETLFALIEQKESKQKDDDDLEEEEEEEVKEFINDGKMGINDDPPYGFDTGENADNEEQI